MKTSVKNGLRAAGVGVAVATAIGFTSVGAAHADTFVPLPDGSITETLPDDVTVTITRTGESANISPSMGATPVHRNVWVSGRAAVQLSGAGASSVQYSRIQPGYVVGCQVNISGTAGAGATGTGGTSAGVTVTDSATAPPAVTSATIGASTSNGLNANVGVTLTPGQTQNFFVLDLEQENQFGERVNRPYSLIRGGSPGSVEWGDTTLGVSGCAGYAQARSYVKVTVSTPTAIQQVTLWGQPFSIG